ncbi:uncharacterized protein LOC106670419 isoform X2 [Cimex lectularius]|uniref:Odorant receptor n=1 Tax=Cimex lectularius TaxID=79782 RepID=A0A8I6TGL8_CIMLE|nr:uncharacterized protein LOC106670419 isoform X2 [Cimex lectularius]
MTIMRLAGMRNDSSDRLIIRYLILFRHLMETLGTIGTIISCYVAGLKKSLGIVMFFSVIGTITNVQSIYTFFYYETGLSVLHDLQELMKKQELNRPASMLHEVTNFTWKWIQIYSFNMISFMIFYSSLPIVVDFFFFILEIEMTPYLPGKPFEGFISITEMHSLEYFSLCLTSIIWTSSSIFSSMGHQILILIFSMYHMLCITVLLERMKKLGRTINDRSVHERDTAEEKMAEKELIEIIQEHNQLLRIGKNINLYFGFPFAMQNTMASGCVCLLMYASVMEINTDISAMLVNAFCLVLMFLIAGIPCILGQRVETLSYQLCDGLYDLPWYKQSPHLRKYLNMALRQANKGMKIHYHGRSPLNHNTLINILNTSYSYFMVLQSSL